MTFATVPRPVPEARNLNNPTLAVWGGRCAGGAACRRHATTLTTCCFSTYKNEEYQIPLVFNLPIVLITDYSPYYASVSSLHPFDNIYSCISTILRKFVIFFRIFTIFNSNNVTTARFNRHSICPSRFVQDYSHSQRKLSRNLNLLLEQN